MILYHGTNADFGDIDLTKSKPNKDFGQGFYLSREYNQAMDMARPRWSSWKQAFPPYSLSRSTTKQWLS